MNTKTEDHAGAKAETVHSHAASHSSSSKKEPKHWEVERMVAQAEIELAKATAQQELTTAKIAADAALASVKEKSVKADAVVVSTRKGLKVATEASKQITNHLQTAVQKLDPEKEELITLQHKLADVDKLLADLTAKHTETVSLHAALKQAENDQVAAKKELDAQLPIEEAKHKVATTNAELNFLRSEVMSSRKASQIRDEFLSRTEDIQ